MLILFIFVCFFYLIFPFMGLYWLLQPRKEKARKVHVQEAISLSKVKEL